MASGFNIDEITVCSICFEKFKIPRYLPCMHSFCHGCLSSYILTACKATESRLGFNCPLCRTFIPCIGETNTPETWAELFPENDILEKLSVKPEITFCQACLRENEQENATDFCLYCVERLCKICTKSHRRGLTTLDHVMIPIKEMNGMSLTPKATHGNNCAKHRDRKLELFCNDHEALCCTMCVSLEHRKCDSINTMDTAATNVRKLLTKNSERLLEDVQILENKLSDAKSEQERFVVQLNNTADLCTETTERAFDNAIDHLQGLKNDYLTKMSKAVKKSKEKCEKCLDAFTDGIQCTDFCTRNIEGARKEVNDVKLVRAFYKSRKTLDELKRYKFNQIRVDIVETEPPILNEIMNLKSLQEAIVAESELDVTSDLRKILLSLVHEFSINTGYVRDGTFLSNREFILSTRKSHRSGTSDETCFVYSSSWECIREIKSSYKPFGILQKGNEVYLGCTSSKVIEVRSIRTYEKIKTIRVPKDIYGIASYHNFLFVACDDKILQLNQYGVKVKEINTGASVKNIILIKDDIVYSNRKTHTVTRINSVGTQFWSYSSVSLKSPCGVEKDAEDNIYVAGKESDNVHVLSCDGELIRIFEDIPRPDFMKIDRDRKLCCVCSQRKNIQVFELK
ncbi:probable E3 ubiquitin-protein ligase MID2 [Saccostrea cucullata]|uniref:probable E3 ubiquitin-protein ligase MID2 n=1 Tax=Saccostrea cuccullata TaxID=36930 RepID=UPI002ED0CF30